MDNTSDPISRMRYFSGEALLREDFESEQDYHRRMRELVNEGVLHYGIVQGLDVTWEISNPNQVDVSIGMAIDADGQQIVLTDTKTIGKNILSLSPNELGYLTIEYSETPASVMGEGAELKRWNEIPIFACSEDPPSDGSKILLAIIKADGNGAIESVYYHHLGLGRTHVGARLGSVQFEPDVQPNPLLSPSSPMSISAQVDMETNKPRLEISAPTIRLDGNVEMEAGSFKGDFNGTGTLTGTFHGTYYGDGTHLTLPQTPVQPDAVNYWTKDALGDLYYTGGNVAVGNSHPSSALFSVGGGSTATRIGKGLVSLRSDNTTLDGFQTDFGNDVKVGDILTFGMVLEQRAEIDQVTNDTELTLKNAFPLSLGPTAYQYESGGQNAQSGGGSFVTVGLQVTGTGTQFQTNGLKSGDALIIAQFVPGGSLSAVEVASVESDTELTLTREVDMEVADTSYFHAREDSTQGIGQGTISVTASKVIGVGTRFSQLKKGDVLTVVQPDAISSVVQKWQVQSFNQQLQQVTITPLSGWKNGAQTPYLSAYAVAPSVSTLVNVGGTATSPIAFAVQANNSGGGNDAPSTVSINVEPVNLKKEYSLQVAGTVGAGSLDVGDNIKIGGNFVVDDGGGFKFVCGGSQVAKIGKSVDESDSLVTKEYLDQRLVGGGNEIQAITVNQNGQGVQLNPTMFVSIFVDTSKCWQHFYVNMPDPSLHCIPMKILIDSDSGSLPGTSIDASGANINGIDGGIGRSSGNAPTLIEAIYSPQKNNWTITGF